MSALFFDRPSENVCFRRDLVRLRYAGAAMFTAAVHVLMLCAGNISLGRTAPVPSFAQPVYLAGTPAGVGCSVRYEYAPPAKDMLPPGSSSARFIDIGADVCRGKPSHAVSAYPGKSLFEVPTAFGAPRKRKDSSIMFYPLLPYQFEMFFKDRQAANIRISFRSVSVGSRDFLEVKRSVSSGNLDADLLSLRYMYNYLAMQNAAFVPDVWQSVSIELSTGGHDY